VGWNIEVGKETVYWLDRISVGERFPTFFRTGPGSQPWEPRLFSGRTAAWVTPTAHTHQYSAEVKESVDPFL